MKKIIKKRNEVMDALKDLIIESRDIDAFKSYQLSNQLAKLLGKYFNSAETRAFVLKITNNVTVNKKTGAREVVLKPEDFNRTENKGANVSKLHKAPEEKNESEKLMNEDKEIAKMLAKELKEYFGDISMAIEYINGERGQIGLELIEIKDYTWGEVKKFIKANIDQILKKENEPPRSIPGTDEEE